MLRDLLLPLEEFFDLAVLSRRLLRGFEHMDLISGPKHGRQQLVIHVGLKLLRRFLRLRELALPNEPGDMLFELL